MRIPTLPLVVLLTSLACQVPAAQAGGVGFLVNSGVHQDRVYYYDADEVQYVNKQIRPNYGMGLEIILGDEDDRILGVARGYYLQDAPPTEPPNPVVDDPIYNIPDTPEHLGVASVGAHWGIFGNPTGFQVHLVTLLGGGIVSVDNLEFIIADLGIGAHYQFAENFQLVGDATLSMRYRKRLYPGTSAYVGIRYLFD